MSSMTHASLPHYRTIWDKYVQWYTMYEQMQRERLQNKLAKIIDLDNWCVNLVSPSHPEYQGVQEVQ